MPEAEPTVKTYDVTPIFNYTRPVEVVKRFIEQLTAQNGGQPHPVYGNDIDGYIDANLSHVRAAVSEIMADDVKQQIADKTFPIRYPAIDFHVFVPYEPNPEFCQDCDGLRLDAIQHTL